MKIGIGSDFHEESRQEEEDWVPDFPTDLDVLILAGDLSSHRKVIKLIDRIAEEYFNSVIIWLAGNHEYYGCNLDKQLALFRETYLHHNRIYFLENDYVQLDQYRIFGCTLWSGFDCLSEENQALATMASRHRISDFRAIFTGTKNTAFTPEHCRERYLESYQWLNQQLAQYPSEYSIVVTHFPPARELRHQRIPEDELSGYFQANCQDLIEQHKPIIWCYGHNHWSDDTMLHQTRCVSNQMGYINEEGSIPTFDTQKIIELT